MCQRLNTGESNTFILVYLYALGLEFQDVCYQYTSLIYIICYSACNLQKGGKAK